MELKELKKKYLELEKKHKLPSFKELNHSFEIDKLDKETDFLLRSIRKQMMEKIVNSVNFLEMLINPANAPRMYFTYFKTMSVEDKKVIDKLYGDLAKLTLFSLDLEVDSSEESEAELIMKTFSTWNELKGDFKRIVGNIKNPKDIVTKKDRGYFG